MKKLILTGFILTVISLLPLKAEHRDRDCRSYNPYPYSHFHPYKSQVVYSTQPVYVVPAATYRASSVVCTSPVVYYPAYYSTPYYSYSQCRPSGLTIKIKF